MTRWWSRPLWSVPRGSLDTTMLSDAELLALWRNGDEDAASRLIRRHFAGVYRFFRSKLDDHVEDLTQRTFMACLEARERLGPDTSFKAYVLGVARKQLLFHLRGKLRHDRRFDLAEVSAVDAGASPVSAVAFREQQQLLLAALRRIPLDLQIAIELFYFEGLQGDDIARVIEIPVGTVRSRLRRAREALRVAIGELEAPAALAQSTIENLEHWAGRIRKEREHGEPTSD